MVNNIDRGIALAQLQKMKNVPEAIIDKLVESNRGDKWLFNAWMKNATKQELADVLVWNEAESLAEYSQFELLEVIAMFESGEMVPRSSQEIEILRQELLEVVEMESDDGL